MRRNLATVSAALLVSTAGMTTSATAAYNKSCSPDSGAHVAKVRLHVSDAVYGYSIYYRRKSGYRLGTNNDEIVFYTPLDAPWWKSPDRGAPRRWINRDAMPNFPGRVERLHIEAIFDRRGEEDARCSMVWNNIP